MFVLDSKSTCGRVVVDDRAVTVAWHDNPELHDVHTGTPHLLHLARETHDRVVNRSRINQWVTPVMVWWADFPQRIAPSRVPQVADAVRDAWSAREVSLPPSARQ